MISNENYKPLGLVDGVSISTTTVSKVLDDQRGLSIILQVKSKSITDSKTVEILFDAYSMYRNCDESYRAKTITDQDMKFLKVFYSVENSQLLHWFNSESLGIYSGTNYVHYSIVTAADWLDVISEFPPEIFVLPHPNTKKRDTHDSHPFF